MILEHDDSDGFAGRVTLDQIFRRTTEARPEATALVERVGDQLWRLSFASVERAVSVLATRLTALGLPQDSVIALQGPASIAQVVALLGASRAGLIPMFIPELWREVDLTPAIESSGARAMISFGDTDDMVDLHCRVAAEVFAVRFVCALRDSAPDGVMALGGLDDLVGGEIGRIPSYRAGNPADHVAVLTWDVGSEGPYLVPRSHRALVAGGVPTLIAGRLDDATVLVSTVALSSFAGLASSVVVWLLAGGTLAIARPAGVAELVETIPLVGGTHLLLPSDVGGSLSAEGHFKDCAALRAVLLLSRAPEQVPTPWRSAEIGVVDVTAWGEAGLLARRRDGVERRVVVPTRADAAAGVDPVATAMFGHRTLQGTLAVAGAMVPHMAFPAPAGSGLPLVAEGAYDTGWTCHASLDGSGLVCDAPPRGVARIGGYRVSLRDAEAKLSKLVDAPVEVAALPHRVLGQRVVAATEGAIDTAAAAAIPLVGISPAKSRRSA